MKIYFIFEILQSSHPLPWWQRCTLEVRWLWRSDHLMQHSITLLLGEIALTQPGGVLVSLSCWKTNDSGTKRKPDGMAYRCKILWWSCWLSVPWILNKSQTVSPAKHPHTSSSMLQGGNHTCGDHPFTYSASHNDTALGTKNLKFGLIRPKDIFPPV